MILMQNSRWEEAKIALFSLPNRDQHTWMKEHIVKSQYLFTQAHSLADFHDDDDHDYNQFPNERLYVGICQQHPTIS